MTGLRVVSIVLATTCFLIGCDWALQHYHILPASLLADGAKWWLLRLIPYVAIGGFVGWLSRKLSEPDAHEDSDHRG